MTAFKDVYERFLAAHASKPMRRLMSATALLDFALSAISLFEPIYLYALGWSLASICLFYCGVYVLSFLLLPLGARFAGRIGFQHSVFFSTPLLIAYYLALYAIPRHVGFIPFAMAAYAFQKVLYWPGFDAEMAAFGNEGERGRELSSLISLSSFVTILGPTFGGVLLGAFGFPVAFALTGLLMLLSNIPLLSMRPERVRESLPWWAAVKRLFSREHRRFLIAMTGFGEEAIATILWPIFLYATLRSYTSTGALVSFSILLSTAVLLAIGRLSDLQSRHAVLRTGSFFTAFSWIIRPFLLGPAGVLAGDFFYRVARALLGVPLTTVIYERAGKGPLIERTALYEMGVYFAKALMLFAAAALSWLLPGNYAVFFLLAFVASLLYAELP